MRSTLATLVEDFRHHGKAVALVRHLGTRRYAATYKQLAEAAGRFAAELERRGVAPGERVVLWGENSAEWVAAFFGCLLRGVLAVPLDAAGLPAFAARVVRDVSPKLIIGDRSRLVLLAEAIPALAFEDFAATLPGEPLFATHPAVTQDTAFQIVFTSGTTSEPKGVVHTHRNVLASLRPIEAEISKFRRYERWVHPLRFLHTLPFSHVFGQFMGLWIPPVLGAEVHLETRLEATKLIELSRRERISVLVAVPRVLELLRAHLLRADPTLSAAMARAESQPVWKRWWVLRSVHRSFGWKFWAVVCGGATVPTDLERFWNVLGFALIQGYGMTETAALVTLNHPFHVGKGTIGKTLPGREVKLNNGEILVRGDMLSGATWQGGRLQARESEWLATGDLAEQAPGGELRFVGRKGDVIVTSAGLNIHPADLEHALLAQPGVRSCVVVGCDGPHGIEAAAAVLWEGSDEGLTGAVLEANRSLADFQQIRQAVRWPAPSFPYTSTGKLLRRDVKAWMCAQIEAQRNSAGESRSADPLLLALAEVTRRPPSQVSDTARLSDDFHLDSLGRVQLQALLSERFGVELADEAVAGTQTLGELRDLLRSQGSAAEPHRTLMEMQMISTVRPADREPGAEAQVYPHWPWIRAVQALRSAFLELILRPLVWLLAAPEVVRDNGDLAGPLLLIANHVTTYDVPLILYALPGALRRRVAVAMAGELLLNLRQGRGQDNWLLNLIAPAGYWLLTGLFNVFPLPRLRGFRRSFAHAGSAMDHGYSVLVFPEGTRTWSEDLAAFRPGIGMLARETRATVLPVRLHGLGDAAASGRRWFRTGRLRVHVGRPVHLDGSTEPTAITEVLEHALREL